MALGTSGSAPNGPATGPCSTFASDWPYLTPFVVLALQYQKPKIASFQKVTTRRKTQTPAEVGKATHCFVSEVDAAINTCYTQSGEPVGRLERMGRRTELLAKYESEFSNRAVVSERFTKSSASYPNTTCASGDGPLCFFDCSGSTIMQS